MKDEKDQPQTGNAGQRSPNYPAVPLPESINDASKIFDKEKRTVLNDDSVVKALGYSGLSGRSRTRLSCLRKYGLLDVVGNGNQISQLALKILHLPDNSERLTAIQEAALRPDVFKHFYQTHKDASEQSISSELVINHKYSPEGAKAFAKSFRETIIFAKLDGVRYTSSDDEHKTEAGSGASTNQPPKSTETVTGTATAIQPGELPIPIGEGRIARVPFPISEEDFELFVETLKLWKRKLVRPLAKPLPPLPSNAMWKNKDSNKPVKIVAFMGEKDGVRFFQSEDGTGLPESELVF